MQGRFSQSTIWTRPLQAYTGKSVADIESANSADSVEAATFNDTLYAFPMTADNGYFLYYDSTVLSEEGRGIMGCNAGESR